MPEGQPQASMRRRAQVIANMSPIAPVPHTHGIDRLVMADSIPDESIIEMSGTPQQATAALLGHMQLMCNAFDKQPTEEQRELSWTSTVGPAAVVETFPYLFALRTGVTVCAPDALRVGVSGVHGLGVFATRNLKVNELVTTYPVDALMVHCGRGPIVVAYRDQRHNGSGIAAEEWHDYKMCTCHKDAYTYAFADPSRHPPHRCGHMLNSPHRTNMQANCVECPLMHGAVTAVCVAQAVAAGEELLIDYGSQYWHDRDPVFASGTMCT